MDKINFLNIPIDAMTMQEILNSINHAFTLNKQIVQNAINAGEVVLMQANKGLEKAVLNSNIIKVDCSKQLEFGVKVRNLKFVYLVAKEIIK